MECPVCGKKTGAMICPDCGFDPSRDYERYPTLMPVKKIPAVSALRKNWQKGERGEEPEKKRPRQVTELVAGDTIDADVGCELHHDTTGDAGESGQATAFAEDDASGVAICQNFTDQTVTEEKPKKKRMLVYITTAIAAVLAIIFFIIPEDQVGPPKPHEYQEEIAAPHVHSWTAATCTSPKMCSLCGETEGKPTEHIWHEATLDRAKYCVNCDAVNGSSLPYSATWCDILETSNESGSQGKDVQFGVFQDIYGSLYNNATQFWVANLPGWANTEHAVYDLSSDFERLEFSIVAGKENQEGGSSKINIYADRTLVYTSNWAGNSTSPIQGTLDVTGVEELRVECTTESGVFCYCIFDAVLYKEA